MPPKSTNTRGEYRGYACHRCHKQKVKCNRERPCRSCALANQPCTYAVRDRKITVSESYLRNLERGSSGSPNPLVGTTRPLPRDAGDVSQQSGIQDPGLDSARRRPFDSVVENSNVGAFVSKLKSFRNSNPSVGAAPRVQFEASHPQSDHSEPDSFQSPSYEYFELSFDTLHEKCTFKLPPYPYVIYLLDQFTIHLGHDWHWFRLRKFRQQLHFTYMTPDSSESKDRTWLCQLLVVLALAESVDSSRPPQVNLDTNSQMSQPSPHDTAQLPIHPPGREFFEQALRLLKVPYENASVSHVEVLNMIALYSNQLNRQKTAYMYAGASARLCNLLQLHQASTSLDCSPVEREHRKRVWWSTFCLDRLTSTQGGQLPTLDIAQTDLAYPTSTGLAAEDIGEFNDPEYLTARVQLTLIQAENSRSVSRFGNNNTCEIANTLRPMLQRLTAWKEALPVHMTLGMTDDLPKSTQSLPCTRSLANLHLRYNQCSILLLRPLLFKQIASIFSNEHLNTSQQDLDQLNSACLASARSNLRIIIELRSYGLLTRLGFMENMHIFTSLMIMRLAMSINSRLPGTFHQNPEDVTMYEAGKDVLRYNMRSGSLAAKGHLNTLKDVEDLGTMIAKEDGIEVNHEGWQVDVDEWMSQMFESESMPYLPEFS